MKYQVLTLDLDGTLTNSKKEITPPTREALIDIQKAGRILILASGRPINGVAPLARKLEMEKYGGYMLSFNGARITKCSTGEVIYNRALPHDVIRPVFEEVRTCPGVDIITYTDSEIISGIGPNRYTMIEAGINKMLVPGDPEILEELMPRLQNQYHGLLNIYRSEPHFLEIMPRNIDKAYSLHRLLSSLGLSAEQMICCGDGYNDVSMIEYAGLGVAMANAQTVVKESADFITRSNDDDGILHVIDLFMR